MKQTLLFCMIIYSSILLANSHFQTKYDTYNQFSTWENQFTFTEKIYRDYRLDFRTHYAHSVNSYFNRSSKAAQYDFNLVYDKYALKPFLIYDYASYYNTGMPEDVEAINDKRVQRTGMGLRGSLIENALFIEQKTNYVTLESPTKDYFGWQNDTKLSYTHRANRSMLNSSIQYANNDIYLDRQSAKSAEIAFRYNNQNHINTRLSAHQTRRELYTYQQKDDTSTREDYTFDIDFKLHFTDNFSWEMANRANFRGLYYSKARSRNNWSLDNNMVYQLNLKTALGAYFTRLNLINGERYFKSNDQTRTSEEKKITTGVMWSFTFVDTLRFEMTNSIVQNFHSGDFNTLDNDRVMHSYSVYFTKNLHNHILQNTFTLMTGEQVYIASQLSANNHRKSSYLWNPEAELYLHPDIRFVNKYFIRADYEYFTFSEYLPDRFYRNMNAEWGVKFINQNQRYRTSRGDIPIATSSGDIPIATSRGDAIIATSFEIYPAFILHHTETAQSIHNEWRRNTSAYQRTYIVSIKYNHPTFSCRLQPSIKYYNKEYETDIIADTSITTDDLLITASINPIGRQFSQMIWRFNLNVEYRF